MTSGTIDELKLALKTKVDFINDFTAKGIKLDGANMQIDPSDLAAARQAKIDADEIKGLIELKQFGIDEKAYLEAPAGTSVAQSIAAQLHNGLTSSELKTLGQMFIESEEFKNLDRSTGKSRDMEYKGFDVGKGLLETKADAGLFTAMPEGNGASPARPFGRIQIDPMIPRIQRAFRVRDLFPVVGTNANLIEYFRVVGFAGGANVVTSGTSGAASVPETTGAAGSRVFGLKPKSSLRFTNQQAPVRTIAHWEAAHRNVLDDEPQLRGVIDNELLYGLRLEEDRQILSGSGNNDELLGVLNTPNIQTYAQGAGSQKADALRRAATRVLIAEYQPTGYVLNPFDWEDVELQKGTGDGQYMLVTNVAIGAQAQVWRQPVVETVAMAEGTFMTGAWGLGAQLYDRQVANVRTTDSHADFFLRNAIVILVEERLALAVKRPEAFVVGTFLANDANNDGTVDA